MLTEKITDTICAISTPLGVGAIGIIRISGNKAKSIAEKFFPEEPLTKPKYLYHGLIIDPITKKPIDTACLLYFKAPFSYTGEDLIEFQVHSGLSILKQLINSLIQNGARLAEKGEFTKRAFLNGKIDLTSAEGIIDLINAKGEKARVSALNQVQGKLFSIITRLKEKIMILLEQLEATLDFPEEVFALDKNMVLTSLNEIISIIKPIIDQQDYGRFVKNGLKCVIIGKPNAGKSSLLNALAGEERAIVTAIPGTTRDFIDITMELNGTLFEFIDTAGLRKPNDLIEELGIKKLSDLITKSEVIIWVIDSSQPISQEDCKIYQKIKHKKNIYILLNKRDLTLKVDLNEFNFDYNLPVIETSLIKNQGLETLKEKLIADFIAGHDNPNNDFFCNIRQISIIKKIESEIQKIIKNLSHYSEEILAYELKQILIAFNELTGEEISEEVINQIFSKFCIGK